MTRKEKLESAGRLAARNRMAIAWTQANEGELAKVVRSNWRDAKVLTNEENAAAIFATRGQTRNPVVVLRNSNLVGVECDGNENLEHYATFGLPSTLTVQSSTSDRLHFYFRPPSDANFTHSGFRIENATVRALSGNYFVWAGALHPSGVEYEVLSDREPARLTSEQYAALIASGIEEDERERIALETNPQAKVAEGRRRDSIFRQACSLRARGFSKEAIVSAMQDWNERHCAPPLTPAQVEAQCNGIERYPDGDKLQTIETAGSEFVPSNVLEGAKPVLWETMRLSDALREAAAAPEQDGIPMPTAFFRCLSLHPGRLYVLGGYPGEGKTSLALQTVVDLAERGGRSLVVTLEMSRTDVAKRCVQIAKGRAWRDVPPDDVGGWEVYFCEDPSVQIPEILRFETFDLIVVDHLHIMGFEDRREIERIVTALKRVSIQFNVPVLLLSQLKDDEEFKRPRMNMYRESRMIEANADLAFFVWRERDSQGNPSELAEILIRKDRYGSPRTELVRFEGEWTRFGPRFHTQPETQLTDEDYERLLSEPDGGWYG